MSEKTDAANDAPKKESFFKKYGVLTMLLLFFTPLFLLAGLGNIAELHPADEYTDAGVHTFTPVDITYETKRRFKRYSWRSSSDDEYDVLYRSDAPESYEWVDQINAGSISVAQEVVDEGKPMEKRVFTLPDGSYVVDDADHDIGDYIRSILLVNGALCLGCLALLGAIFGPWIRKNFLSPDAPPWTVERVQKGSAVWLMIIGIIIGFCGLTDNVFIFEGILEPLMPEQVAAVLFGRHTSRWIFTGIGVALLALGTKWSNKYSTDEDEDDGKGEKKAADA